MPAHPLAGLKSVSIRQLGAESFVAHNVVSPYRLKVLDAFKHHKTPLNMDVEMPTIETIKRFVAAGNGVALVPRLAVEPELARGELRSVPVKELASREEAENYLSQRRAAFARGAGISENR